MTAGLWFVAAVAAVGVLLVAVLVIRRGGRPAVIPGVLSVAELRARENADVMSMYPSPCPRGGGVDG